MTMYRRILAVVSVVLVVAGVGGFFMLKASAIGPSTSADRAQVTGYATSNVRGQTSGPVSVELDGASAARIDRIVEGLPPANLFAAVRRLLPARAIATHSGTCEDANGRLFLAVSRHAGQRHRTATETPHKAAARNTPLRVTPTRRSWRTGLGDARRVVTVAAGLEQTDRPAPVRDGRQQALEVSARCLLSSVGDEVGQRPVVRVDGGDVGVFVGAVQPVSADAEDDRVDAPLVVEAPVGGAVLAQEIALVPLVGHRLPEPADLGAVPVGVMRWVGQLDDRGDPGFAEAG
jgi:hypothetical protein